MIRPLYHYVKNKNEREFHRLYDKWGGCKRYERVNNVKFLQCTFDIPDLPSFIWQFKEIFVDDALETDESETTIELNLAVLKFKHTIKKKKQ